MFPVQLRVIDTLAGAWLSIEVNREGIFLLVAPLELALLWPWIE